MLKSILFASLLLAACGDAPTEGEPPPEIPSARLDSIELPDGNKVTQGGTLRVVVTGAELGSFYPQIEGASLIGSLGGPEERTYTLLVDEGAPLGARSFVLDASVSSGFEDLVVENAFEVTATYVDPAGSDTASGTAEAPLRTLAEALERRKAAGSEVVLSADNHWVTDFFIVYDGVVVRGAGPSATTITVPSCGTYFTCGVVHGELSQVRFVSQIDRALAVEADGLLADAEVIGGETGVALNGRGRLQRVSVSGAGRGVVASPEEASIVDCQITDHSQGGIVGLSLSSAGRLTVERTILARNDQGIVTSTDNPLTIVVRGSTLETNRIGVHMTSTDSTLTLDMGSPLSPGGNVFKTNLTHISDERTARTAADGPVASFAGSTFDGTDPEGMVTGQATKLPIYTITQANNRLSF
jgi:hypothetical protein